MAKYCIDDDTPPRDYAPETTWDGCDLDDAEARASAMAMIALLCLGLGLGLGYLIWS